jgi:tRNA (guanine6-N2)-methyltransferase
MPTHGSRARGLSPKYRPRNPDNQISRIEFTFLPGLDSVVEAELRERLPGLRGVRTVTGRSDEIGAEYAGPWEPLLSPRTIIAPFLVLSFPVPRPGSLVSGEYFPEIVAAARLVGQLSAEPARTFRFDAAGSSSAGYRRPAAKLADATGLRYEATGADLVLRFRRALDSPQGWDVLVRLCTRPLSRRPWRVRNFPGAANACVAAAMTRLAGSRPSQRFANLMCGSGTLLIERLLAVPARTAVAVDNDADVLAACAGNLKATGLRDRVRLVHADIAEDAWAADGPFDVIMADPPWGTLSGSHDTNEALHTALLERAYTAAAPGARLVVLTHEIRIMERCLRQASRLWTEQHVVRVFQKGHHPRIYVLARR